MQMNWLGHHAAANFSWAENKTFYSKPLFHRNEVHFKTKNSLHLKITSMFCFSRSHQAPLDASQGPWARLSGESAAVQSQLSPPLFVCDPAAGSRHVSAFIDARCKRRGSQQNHRPGGDGRAWGRGRDVWGDGFQMERQHTTEKASR